MRLDQIARLQELSEGITDVVITEMDTDTWPGAGKPLAEISKDERGDRYWCKKNAAASMTLLVKLLSVTGMLERARYGNDPTQPDDADGSEQHADLDQTVAEAEQRAVALLAKAQAGRQNVH